MPRATTKMPRAGSFAIAVSTLVGAIGCSSSAPSAMTDGRGGAPLAQTLAAPEQSGYVFERDVLYRAEDEQLTDAMRERCRLDVYYPTNQAGFATIVWFHAGGLRSGEKWTPPGFQNQGLAVVSANYRLHPDVHAPAYIEDAAAAVAWTLDNIERFGGDPESVFVSGHSAGGYLASMIALDPRWLEPHGADPDQLAGAAPISGHTITHFTVRQERGIAGTTAVIDDLAPQFHVRNDAPPFLLITGDRERELFGRYEENAFFWRMMRVVGHPDTTIYELGGYDHGGVVNPAQRLVVDFVNRLTPGR